MIPYIEDEDSETLDLIIDPDENIEKIKELQGLSLSGNYEEDCYNECNFSTLLIASTLHQFGIDFVVKEGVFDMLGNHTWIEVGGWVVDATLKQFIPKAKKLCIIDNEWSSYQAVKSYSFEDWVENSPNLT